ncbi:MAG: hypothetical protein SFW67_37105 [Myxococcaceae bacterium]|nr:hypothetical protein [Myxococcaceae bacterium]
MIFAAEAPVGVVIARGPSRWTNVSRWDVMTDTVTRGAWFKGRLYETKCDLSPDGELFLAALFKGRRAGTPFTDSWTAISRLPWLYALALWPIGTTYGGGGRFVGPREVTLRGVGGPHPDFSPDGIVWKNGPAALHASSGEVEGAEWSGRDARNRLVFTREGQLFVRTTRGERRLYDFRDAQAPTEAPEWAKAALGPKRRRRHPPSQS